jgi:hypothetical protein
MSCGSRHGAWDRWAELEQTKAQQRAAWTAALTGAVSGAVSGARGGTQVRVGDAEREQAVSALGEHYVAGRLTKDELDERADRAWSARTSGDLAPLFRDLPALPPPAPVRSPRREAQRRSWRLGLRLSWIFVLLVVLAAVTRVPFFAVALFAFFWWSGMFSGLHRWASRQAR